MEFRIRPVARNTFPPGAILIRNSSPAVWLEEAQQLFLDLSRVKAYAVPGAQANVLYGCIFICEQDGLPANMRSNQSLQMVEGRLFIPEHSHYYPEIHTTEWDKFFPESFYLLHPETGLVKLDEPVNWMALLDIRPEKKKRLKIAAESVPIPEQIRSFSVSLDDEALRKELLAPKTEQELLDNLPFDLKKLMNGNQKEMEKYLRYLQEHPEKAIALGLPLDMLGTSRNSQRGQYTFAGAGMSAFATNFMNRIFSFGGADRQERTPRFAGARNKSFAPIVALIGVLWLFSLVFRNINKPDHNLSSTALRSGAQTEMGQVMRDSLRQIIRSVEDNRPTVKQNTADTQQDKKRFAGEVAVEEKTLAAQKYTSSEPAASPRYRSWNLLSVMGMVCALLGGIVVLRLLFGRTGVPGHSIWHKIDMGTRSGLRKLMYVLVLLSLLLLIFYPLLYRFGFDGLSIVVTGVVALMLYRLLKPS